MNHYPEDPQASKFGWPFDKRRVAFKRLQDEGSKPTFRVVFQGRPQDFPIIRVPIGLPKYRLANGRTASSQVEWLANNPSMPTNYFQSDEELIEVQQIQHSLLLKVVNEAGLLTFFKDTKNAQVDPILLNENGFVVNGNRRLCCWRDLLKDDVTTYGKNFEHIDVVVLPHCDEKEIDRIEAALQIARDIRADYSWETQALMFKSKLELHGFTTDELAEIYNMSRPDLDNLFEMLALAAEYLKSRGWENQWSRVKDNQLAFDKLVDVRRNATPGDRELLREGAYTMIDNPAETGGRLYDAIPRMREHLPAIKVKLEEVFKVDMPEADSEIKELFGDDAPTQKMSDKAIPLAAEIKKPENASKARQIIVEAIASQEEMKKDRKKADYLLKMLARANANLHSIIADALKPESSTDGVMAQIEEMRKKLGTIEKWVGDHA